MDILLLIAKNATSSTCSESATARGHGQRIISFAFYNNRKIKNKLSHSSMSSTDEEFTGIMENLKLVEKYYPSYTMRLYTDITEKTHSNRHSELCAIYCNHPKLDICNVYRLGNQNITNINYLRHPIIQSYWFWGSCVTFK